MIVDELGEVGASALEQLYNKYLRTYDVNQIGINGIYRIINKFDASFFSTFAFRLKTKEYSFIANVIADMLRTDDLGGDETMNIPVFTAVKIA